MPVLNPNHCRAALDGMRHQILAHRGKPAFRCAELSALVGVDVLSVVLYAMRPDVLGPLPELVESAAFLTTDYKYTRIEPWEDLQ